MTKPSLLSRQRTSTFNQALKDLHAYVTNLSAHSLPTASAQPPPSPAWEPRASDSKPYDGILGNCCGFLLQCSHVFSLCYQTFHSDKSRSQYIVGLIQGRALAWAEDEDSCSSLAGRSLVSFLEFGVFVWRCFKCYILAQKALGNLNAVSLK